MRKLIILCLGFFILIFNSSVGATECSEEYNPVCGPDNVTYQNSCFAKVWMSPFFFGKIKYEGECLSSSLEKTILDAWKGFNDNYIKIYDDNIRATLYEELIVEINKLESKNNNSKKISMYNYFESLIVKELNDVYFTYLVNNIDNTVKKEPLGEKWHIVSLDRVTKNEINFHLVSRGQSILVTIYIGVENNLIYTKSIYEELLK